MNINPSQNRFGLAIKIAKLEANVNLKDHTTATEAQLRKELKQSKDEFVKRK